MAHTTSPVATKTKRGWFGRNWKWFIPVSLLSALVIGGGIGFFVSFGPNLKLKGTQAYTDTVKAVTNDAAVKAALGDNIKVDTFLGMPSGSHEERTIQLVFPIKGSQGRGDVQSTAQLINGVWGLSRVVVKTGQAEIKIDVGDDTPKFNAGQSGTSGSNSTDKPPESLDLKIPGGDEKAPDVNLNLDGDKK